LQYYATVDEGAVGSAQNIRWLTRENVKDWPTVEDGGRPRNEGLVGLADMAGCGQSVGGVVSDTAGTIPEVLYCIYNIIIDHDISGYIMIFHDIS